MFQTVNIPNSIPVLHYFTVCTIVRDEPDLPEWVAYHLAIGAEHIFLYDNESRQCVRRQLHKFVAAGSVSVARIEGRQKQCLAYQDMLRRMADNSEWVAFIDADEFLLPHRCDDIRNLLPQYAPFGGLAVNWIIFGANGHARRPPGLVIENYTKCSSSQFTPNELVKCIVNPRLAYQAPNPHFFLFRSGAFCVDETEQPVSSWLNPRIPVDTIQINHYFVKSAEDWELKRLRRGGCSGQPRTVDEFRIYDSACKAKDERILRFASRVRQSLES